MNRLQQRAVGRINLFEALEGRQMMSVTPLVQAEAASAAQAIHATPFKKASTSGSGLTATLSSDGILTVIGTGGNDDIYLRHLSDGRVHVQYTRRGTFRTAMSFRARNVVFLVVKGGNGNDYVDLSTMGGRTALIEGGRGNDFILGSKAVDHLEGGSGDDEIHGLGDGDVLFGDTGNDTLLGQAGDDYIVGGDGADKIIGGLGDDTLVSKDGKATDYLSGGPGNDSATADLNPEYDPELKEWEMSSFISRDVENIHT